MKLACAKPSIPSALSSTLVLAASLLIPVTVLAAQEPAATPKGTGGGVEAASAGSTDLGGAGEFATTQALPDAETACKDATELEISAGGVLATGNSKSVALTGRTEFRLRRYIHQLTATALGNYGAGASETATSDKFEQNVGNLQGRVRYDVFFADRWSAFLMGTVRRDTFQGLDMRMRIDPGVAFHILTDTKHRLWVELGYDYQLDLVTEEAFLTEAPVGTNPKKIDTADRLNSDHAGRLYLGYANRLHESLGFDTGVEYIQSFLQGDAFRLAYDVGLTAQLPKNFAVAMTFQLRYDNAPVAKDIEKLDTTTAFNVMFRM